MSEKRESFFVGGRYVETADGQRMAGQAYVQRWSPEVARYPFPVVMIHGGHQTAVNFETTPDGRPGWGEYFVRAGFTVYLMDQPGIGRSAYLEEAYGPPDPTFDTHMVEERFTAPGAFKLWPSARLHTQWPGSGREGDPVFDQFYASQVPNIKDPQLREQLVREAGVALLDEIGPALVMSHSLSGSFGWLIGDARPELVKAIIAVEPGRPFFNAVPVGAPDYFRDGDQVARPFGLTMTPIGYDPPVGDPAVDLPYVQQSAPDEPGVVCCHLQQEPARRLVNLARVPVVVVTAEASWHTGYDHCTVRYLSQAGVDVSHVRLADEGVRGNGHMMMLEENSDAVAEVIRRWVEEHIVAA